MQECYTTMHERSPAGWDCNIPLTMLYTMLGFVELVASFDSTPFLFFFIGFG